MKGLSATNLKTVLWETLNDIKSDKMLPAQGDAIASQAREILRTVKVQLQIAAQTKRSVPTDVVDFAERPNPVVIEGQSQRRKTISKRAAA